MRAISPQLVETLVRHYSFGATTEFDPGREIGTQRESYQGLGFGWLYLALADILQARNILVVGSGRGFAVACFALGVEARHDARVWLVDPGFARWEVERGLIDLAPGMWRDAAEGREHFRRHLQLDCVECLPMRSDEAFADFRRAGLSFDLILVDGNHSFEQVGRDLDNALASLAPRGVLLLHDTACPLWPGPRLALERFLAADRRLQSFTLPLFPGLSLVQRGTWPLEIRRASAAENERINAWRAEAGITQRPLCKGGPADPDDGPADPRTGLFAILDDGELVGGFGLRYRRFGAAAADDFVPCAPEHAEGFLLYGAVLRPESRGRGRWLLVTARLAVLFPEGFYLLTRYPFRGRGAPHEVAVAGQASVYTAYRVSMPGDRPIAADRPPPAGPPGDLARARDQADLYRRQAELARAEVAALRASRTWRATAPLRAIMDRIRAGGAEATSPRDRPPPRADPLRLGALSRLRRRAARSRPRRAPAAAPARGRPCAAPRSLPPPPAPPRAS